MVKNKNLKNLIFFSFIFLVYVSNAYLDYKKDLNTQTFRNLLTSHDVVTNNLIPYQILKTGTLNFYSIKATLNKIRPSSSNSQYFIIKKSDNIYYSSFPLVTGILSTPLFLLPIKTGWINNLETARDIDIIKMMFISRVAASLLTTLSIYLFYKIISSIHNKPFVIYSSTIYFAFGTLMWSISSRSLWQHTSAVLFINLCLYILYSKKRSKKDMFLAGLSMGLGVLSRYSVIFILIPLVMYLFLYERKNLKNFILGGVPALVLLFLNNYLFYGSVFNTGYNARQDVDFSTGILTGVEGLLVSPGKGLLFIMPTLFLCLIFALYLFTKKEEWKEHPIENFLLIGFVLNLLFFSKWYAWHGADTFGPRFLIEFVPFLCIVLARLLSLFKNKVILYFILITFIYSFYVQFNAVFFKMSRCHPRDTWNFECVSPPKEISDYFELSQTFYDSNKKYIGD